MLFLLLIPVFALAQTIPGAAFYRFTDEQGRTHISDKISPAQVPGGYEILDRRLYVLKRVAPAPTEAELAERDRLAAEQARIEQQAKQDRALLDRFPTVDDVSAAERSEIERLELQRDIQTRTLEIHQRALSVLQRRAAREERDGEVSIETLNALQGRELDVLKAQQSVAERAQALADMRALYQARRERVAMLTQVQSEL